MKQDNNSGYVINGFGIFVIALMVVSFWTSCGKDNVTAAGASTQIMVVNASPDDTKINLFINTQRQNTSAYLYNSTPVYEALKVVGQPLQLRYSTGVQKIIATNPDSTKSNVKYTLFLTGLGINKKLSTILTIDTDFTPKVGSGKMRFVNAASSPDALDIWANGIKLYNGIDTNRYTKFLEMPAGNYDIKVYRKNDLTTLLYELNPVTVADGKLYSLFTYGIAGRTDTTAFTAKVLTNR